MGICPLPWESMGLMAETWASVMASSALGRDQLAPGSSSIMAAAKESFSCRGQVNNSSPHNLKR